MVIQTNNKKNDLMYFSIVVWLVIFPLIFAEV